MERSNMPQIHFHPNADQAALLNAGMHTALLSSLEYLAEATGRSTDTFSWPQHVRTGGKIRPQGFAAYYDLVDAIQNDRHADIPVLFQAIEESTSDQRTKRVLSLDTDYAPDIIERFQRYMGNGKTGASGIAGASREDIQRFTHTLNAAFDWIGQCMPSFSAEFDCLIEETILVAPDGTSEIEFEGGSSFRLWGALFLNAESEFGVGEMVTSLAHEQAHTVLFGLCRDEMLVENPDSELFWSPIRQTERPMEGIFHATFVSARMMGVLLRIQGDSTLSGQDKRAAKDTLEHTTSVYHDGLDIIKKHARPTQTGRKVLVAMEHATVELLAAL